MIARRVTEGEITARRSVEEAIEEALAFGVHVVGSFQQRPVEIAPAVALGGDRLLLEEPVEQRADRGLLPRGAPREGLHDVIGRHRLGFPEHVHHQAFGVADRHALFYVCNSN